MLHYFPIPWCPWIIKKNTRAHVHWESQRLNKKWNEMVKMNIEMNPYSSLFTIALEPLEFATTPTQLNILKKFRNAHNLTKVFLQSNLHT